MLEPASLLGWVLATLMKEKSGVPGWEKSSPVRRLSVCTCVYLFCE